MASDPHDPYPFPAESIRFLTTVEHVRLNPGMYIGNTGPWGLGILLYQLVYDSLAETMAGHGQSVRVALLADGAVEIEDDGRIPADADIGRGCTALDGTVTPWNRPLRAGRIWWGYAVASALSEWFVVEARHGGHVHRQEFRRGEAVSPLTVVGKSASAGLSVAFRPDPTIFDDARLSASDVRWRLQQYAFLHSGVRITLTDAADRTHEQFEYEDGIRAVVEFLADDLDPVHTNPIVVRGEREGVRFEAALRWHREADERVRAYANGEYVFDEGTPVAGVRAAVTRSLNRFVRSRLPGVRPLKGHEARAGLTAVVSVWLADPTFWGSTRSRLSNPEVRRAVEAGVGQVLREYFEQYPNVAERVIRIALDRPKRGTTEAAWLASGDPTTMLTLLRGKASDRKLRLFACACCRHVAHLFDDAQSVTAIDVAERFADGWASNAERRAAHRVAQAAVAAVLYADISQAVESVRTQVAILVARPKQGDIASGGFIEWDALFESVDPAHQEFLRDIFGNPFRPVAVDPRWLTSTVVSLAETIYADRAFDRLPIVADALQDAGCEDIALLAHCRGPGPHVRGCWVVDLVLGKG